jgi:hypothetical protein
VTAVAAPAPDPARDERETRLGRVLLGVSFVAAIVLGSNFFQVSSWIAGDISYHRGVALTMQGAAWQGEGPYVGLLSYYGGLYPLVLGQLAKLFNLPFDMVVSAASWPFALSWPLSLWYLGRRIWPASTFAVGVFVLLGTTAAPFTHRVLTWVDSVLASAQNTFPVYPRDVAMVLLAVLAGMALSPLRRTRVVGTGVALAGIVLVHLQMAVLGAWLLTTWAVIKARRARSTVPLREVAISVAIAIVLSSWWWLPRLGAVVQSGGLLLTGYPGAPELRLGLQNFLMAFGVVGVLAALALTVLLARRPLPGQLFPFVIWIAAFVPLIALDRAIGGFDLLSERRVWLVLSIPLTVLAASVAVLVARTLRPRWALAFLLVVLIVPSVPGAIGTSREIANAWTPGRAGGRVFDAATWDPLFAELNRRVRTNGRYVVATYDAYETWVWSFSGAQVPSMWLPGPFKLGFDPARLTGTGQAQRVSAQTEAFQSGRGGICSFARAISADAVLLDVESGNVGLRDIAPAAPYRVDPRARNETSISRLVAPGIEYRDRGSVDALGLSPGSRWAPGWEDPSATLLAIELTVALAPGSSPGQAVAAPVLLRVSDASGMHEIGGLGPGFHRVLVPIPDGIHPNLSIEAIAPFDLQRVTAFEPAPDLAAADGPIVVSVPAACGATALRP